ncbi:unnamed protein product [Heterobilharzia americana]|nr:unnamed protein product [Heterobilharzia americana]
MFRANVTLKLGLSNDFSSECDETVYKVLVCAGEFTNQCQLVGPISRFIQATCASQGPPESLSFLVSSVENPIELDVTVQKVGEQEIQQLRNTEFRLTEESEISVTSLDLSLIVRFHVAYSCLPNYFGKTCTKFCDQQAVEYRCDQLGNMFCKPGYYMDQKFQKCRSDQCLNKRNYCLNGGVCMNNPNIETTELPICICPTDFRGLRCELRNHSMNNIFPVNLNTIPLKETEFKKNNSFRIEKSLSTTTESKEIQSTEYMNTKESKSSNSNDVRENPLEMNSDFDRQVKTTAAATIIINSTVTPDRSPSEIVMGIKNPKLVNEQNWRKVIVLSSIGIILILTISTGCVGLVLCFIRRKPKTNKQSNISNIITSDSDCYYKPARRWASVDQSPSSLNHFDSIDCRIYPGTTNNGNVTGIGYSNSFRESQMQTTNFDANYGIDDISSLPNYHPNQNQYNHPYQNCQPFRHSSASNTGYQNNELVTENGFATIPRNYYLSNRYMNWSGSKQPSFCVPTVKPLSLDTGNYIQNYEEGYDGPSMANFNSNHSNNFYPTNEQSTFAIDVDETNDNTTTTAVTIINSNSNNSEHLSRYPQPSYNCLSSSVHDGYISNGYFDRLSKFGNDSSNQNDIYATRNDNNYLAYKTILGTVSDINRHHMNSSTLPPTMSYSSSLPPPPPPPLLPPPIGQAPPPPTQFADLTNF